MFCSHQDWSRHSIPKEANGRAVICSFTELSRGSGNSFELTLVCYNIWEDRLGIQTQLISGVGMASGSTSGLFYWNGRILRTIYFAAVDVVVSRSTYLSFNFDPLISQQVTCYPSSLPMNISSISKLINQTSYIYAYTSTTVTSKTTICSRNLYSTCTCIYA